MILLGSVAKFGGGIGIGQALHLVRMDQGQVLGSLLGLPIGFAWPMVGWIMCTSNTRVTC